MKTKSILGVMVIALSCSNATSNPEKFATEVIQSNDTDLVFNFDNDEAGKLPLNWTAATSTWMIAGDGNNHVMKQAAKNDGDQFNICVEIEQYYQDLEMEVRIKALEGNEDQGGGLVWRYQDKENYYIARANPLENNFRLYKVVNGNRKQLESAHVKMNRHEWFTLKVIMIGNHIECSYNGQKLIGYSDDTFHNKGLVGFWTKADAVSLFDDLKIKDLK